MRDELAMADKLLAVRAVVVDGHSVLTDGRIALDAGGDARKSFHRRDAIGLELARAAGWPVAVILTDDCPVLSRWVTDHGLELCTNVRDKAAQAAAFAAAQGLSWNELAYLGGELDDLPALRQAALGATPGDGAVLVRKKADLVLELGSGQGALRELLERLIDAQGRTCEVLERVLAARGVADDAGIVAEVEGASGRIDQKIGFRR